MIYARLNFWGCVFLSLLTLAVLWVVIPIAFYGDLGTAYSHAVTPIIALMMSAFFFILSAQTLKEAHDKLRVAKSNQKV